MQAVDELCRSFLDLLAHADPSRADVDAPGAARLAAWDEETRRQQAVALRSLAAAVEDLELEALEDEVDRTVLLGAVRAALAEVGSDAHARLPSRRMEHLLRAFTRGTTALGEGAVEPVVARLEAMPDFLTAAAAELREPWEPSRVEALALLGPVGVAVAEAAARVSAAAPTLAERAAAAGEQALRALRAFGVSLSELPTGDDQGWTPDADRFAQHLAGALFIGAPPGELERTADQVRRAGLDSLGEAAAPALAEAARAALERPLWRSDLLAEGGAVARRLGVTPAIRTLVREALPSPVAVRGWALVADERDGASDERDARRVVEAARLLLALGLHLGRLRPGDAPGRAAALLAPLADRPLLEALARDAFLHPDDAVAAVGGYADLAAMEYAAPALVAGGWLPPVLAGWGQGGV